MVMLWRVVERPKRLWRGRFSRCADVLDGEAFEASTSNEKSAEEEARKSFVACDKGRSELARRARFYARSTRASGDERDENENGDGESATSGMYARRGERDENDARSE